jgi:hypothetical protein
LVPRTVEALDVDTVLGERCGEAVALFVGEPAQDIDVEGADAGSRSANRLRLNRPRLPRRPSRRGRR